MKRLLNYYLLFIALVPSACAQSEKRVSLDSDEFAPVINALETGTWIWHEGNCQENRQSFKFDIENKTVTLKLAEPVGVDGNLPDSYVYEILWAWSEGFRGKIIGEERLDKNGSPVEWDLILVDENSFYWRRNDWSSNLGTQKNTKCPE